ncbi:uncharacterized protein B0I36DRAFT_383449 [Microdochium trichocladiopsis]|uniref:Rhodopsin domain-containing protein n=1 Tax=Microdochium trichocladiopsis TaxID=1682393 RepID=A0A9P9BPZ5_9PEZI|nr:uncharacterized protein B0I36DRAFT_383449 [Microdochium trichocladiopsis]KAH7033624.1 hypothetical protein B0I36DRAFT_383449 [Microdochium trichocladiopsis]
MDLPEAYLRESKSSWVIAVAWSFTGLAIIAVTLKIVTTTRISRSAGWDDFFIVLSLILSIIASFFVHYAAVLGLGRHTMAVFSEFGPERLAMTAKMQILGYPFNIGAFSLPNIAIAILVIKLLDPNPWRKYALIAMAILQVLLAVVMAIMAFVQCSPVDKLWNRGLDGSCWDPSILNNYSYFVSAYTTLTDLALAVVPISAFWNLQMNMSTKIGIMVLMGLTFLSAIVTLIKATFLHLFNDTEDPLWNVVTLVFWGLIEQNIVIFAACVPTLRPLFARALRPLAYSNSPSQSNSLGNNTNLQSFGLRSLASTHRFRTGTKSGGSNGSRLDAGGDGDEKTTPKSADENGSLSEMPLSHAHRQDNEYNDINSAGSAIDLSPPDGGYARTTGTERHDRNHKQVTKNNSRDGSSSTRSSSSGIDADVQFSHNSRQGIWKRIEVSMQWDEDGDGDEDTMPTSSARHGAAAAAGSVGAHKCDGRGTGIRAEMCRKIIVPESLTESVARR